MRLEHMVLSAETRSRVRRLPDPGHLPQTPSAHRDRGLCPGSRWCLCPKVWSALTHSPTPGVLLGNDRVLNLAVQTGLGRCQGERPPHPGGHQQKSSSRSHAGRISTLGTRPAEHICKRQPYSRGFWWCVSPFGFPGPKPHLHDHPEPAGNDQVSLNNEDFHSRGRPPTRASCLCFYTPPSAEPQGPAAREPTRPRREHSRGAPTSLTSLATSSFRCRPYLATTGRSTSVTGLVGLALSPTDRLIGTRSSLVGGDTRTASLRTQTQLSS